MSLGWMGQLCTRTAIGQAAQAANQPDEFAPLLVDLNSQLCNFQSTLDDQKNRSDFEKPKLKFGILDCLRGQGAVFRAALCRQQAPWDD